MGIDDFTYCRFLVRMTIDKDLVFKSTLSYSNPMCDFLFIFFVN